MGASQIFSAAGPIQSLKDFKGKVFRAKSPGIEVKWMELLGSKVTVMPFSELYNALQQRVVELMHNPARDAIADKFYEVCKNLTVTNHKYFGYLVLVNTKFWNSLPADIQKIISSSWEEAAYAWTAEAIELEQSILEQLQKPPYNMKVYFPTPQELEKIRNAVMPVYDFAKTSIGADKVDLLLKNVK
jgi:C4-dicarboxylate-binding protein DctP